MSATIGTLIGFGVLGFIVWQQASVLMSRRYPRKPPTNGTPGSSASEPDRDR